MGIRWPATGRQAFNTRQTVGYLLLRFLLLELSEDLALFSLGEAVFFPALSLLLS